MFLNFISGDMNLCFRPVLSILQSSFLFPNPLADFFSAKIRKNAKWQSFPNVYFPEKGCHLGTNRSDNET